MTSKKEKAAQFENEVYDVHVTGRNVLVTDPMKDYAVEKISKLERFSHRVIDVYVTMDIQKLEHRVDIMLSVDHLKIKSHAASDNMYASIDKAVDRLEKQLRRYKTKIQDHQARALGVVDMRVNVFKAPPDADLEDINLAIEDENQKEMVDQFRPHDVVSTETAPLKSLTLDEAIMKMELSGDAFMVYRGEEDKKLKVIYRRKDRNFGVIEVESST